MAGLKGAGVGVGDGLGVGVGVGVGVDTAHTLKVDPLFRGLGVPVLKSDPLLLVSVQPPTARNMDVVLLLGPDAAPAPSKKFALPYPTKSIMCAASLAEHAVELPLQAKPAEVSTRTTLPAPAAMFMPVALLSSVGSATPVVPPDPSFTREYWPGASEPERVPTLLEKSPVPVALEYCTDQLPMFTVEALRLKSST